MTQDKINDKTEYKAKVVGKDPYMDLAVLEIESNEKFVPVTFGDSDIFLQIECSLPPLPITAIFIYIHLSI